MPLDIKPVVTGQGITPEMPTEVPADIKAMEFSIDPTVMNVESGASTIKTNDGVELKETPAEFKTQKNDEKTVEAVKKEEVTPKIEVEKKEEVTPKKEEVKVEVKKEDTKVAGKPAIKPISPIKDKTAAADDTFDYAKYSPQEVINMKNMSRQSRESYAKLIDDNKQLATLKDATYLQHEQGYTLAPEFTELRNKEYLARTEGRCWQDALLNIKAGRPFKEITGFDNQGRPIMSEEKQPSDIDEIRIAGNLTACSNAVNAFQGELQQFPTKFKGRIQQDLREIDAEQHARFAWVQDPKLLEHPIEVEGQGSQKIKDIKTNFKSLFPSYLANTPGVEVASNLMVALMIQSAELREAQNGRQVAQIKQSEAQRAEPTSDTREVTPTKLAAKGVPSVFSLEGLPSR